MQRHSILAVTATVTLIVLLVSVPLAQAKVQTDQYATTAQFVSGVSIYDQIDSMLNNLTKRLDVNPLTPANQQATSKATTPSVKIANVKVSNQGQSNAKPSVTVTLQNGNAAANGVRVSVFYSTTGSATSSNSTVVSLNAGETRAIEFSPNGLAAGSYGVSVVAFKDGTDPSNKATPPYDMRENAATLTVTPTPTAAPTERATEVQDNPNAAFSDVLSQVNTWALFVIVITVLITIALFFVFSQNKSGEDRFEENHFKDEYPPGGLDTSGTPPTPSQSPSTAGQPPKELTDTEASPRRRQIAIDAAETDESARTKSYGTAHQSSTERSFNSDGYIIGDVSSKKALRDKIRGKKGA